MGKVKRRTQEEFCEEIKEKFNNEIEVLGIFTKTSEKVLVKHTCGHEWSPTANNLLREHGCPKCSQEKSIKKRRRKQEEFTKKVYDLVKDEYIFLEPYFNNITHLMVRHNICNHEYPVTPKNFLKNKRCPKCYGNEKKTTEQFKQEVYCLEEDNYLVLSEYIDAQKYVQMKHNICGHEYPVTPHNFLRGRRCPLCAESKGEQVIQRYHEKNNINFIPQKEFEGLVGLGGGNLSYDSFAIDYNLLIEYQGEQHEKYLPWFHKTIEDFEKQVEHDKRKKEYAEQNGYNLLEIWYYDFDNIEEILESKIKELS